MNPFLIGIVLLGVLIFIFRSNIGNTVSDSVSSINNERFSLDDIYQKYGKAYNIDWRLLKAVSAHESNENPEAVRDFPGDQSIGLMQILCLGWPNMCSNKFNVIGWPPSTPNLLLDPDYNVSIGVQILKYDLDTFGFPKGIAVYNKWSARSEEQPFSNQEYVDDVLRRYQSFGGNI